MKKGLLLACALALFIGCNNNEQLIQNNVSQDNHKQVVRLKKDVITCLRLEAKWDQKWNFKTCDDYELIKVLNTKSSRGRGGWIESVEVWMKVKRPFFINLDYEDWRNNKQFLYVKLDFVDERKSE